MNNVQFNVNSSAIIDLTHKLEKLHRSAFPIAVRTTLNDAAFDMKTNTLQESAKKNFIIRAPTFFRRFTTVQKANGFDVNAMNSKVGFTDQGQPKVDAAIQGMDYQESGGKITSGLEYYSSSRISNNSAKAVRMNKRFNKENVINIQNIYNRFTRKRVGTTKSRLVATAIMAARTGMLIKEKKNGKSFYIAVTKVDISKQGKVNFTSKIMYASRNDSNKPVKATHFNEEAAVQTQQKMAAFYKKNAEKQFAKYMK